MASNGAYQRILISNDDGVNAPGLRAFAAALHAEGVSSFAVCGPTSERSAQSHAITIGKHLHAFNIDVEGAQEAYAVDGTPADSVMLALHGGLLENSHFDCIVSGINRGDNLGLHVIYSGTVGAAREAACKNIPALAFSLADYTARTVEQYAASARCAAAIVRAALTVLPSIRGYVVNVNFPPGETVSDYKGIKLCSQGIHCTRPDFQEVATDPHFESGKDHADHFAMGKVTLRAFKNAAGLLQADHREGTDSRALSERWIAVTVVGLRSDVPLIKEAAAERTDEKLVNALETLVKIAGDELGLEVDCISSRAVAVNGEEKEATAVA